MKKRPDHFTISIPKHIRKAMEEYQKTNKVNWSKIAGLAFLDYIEKRKRKTDF